METHPAVWPGVCRSDLHGNPTLVLCSAADFLLVTHSQPLHRLVPQSNHLENWAPAKSGNKQNWA